MCLFRCNANNATTSREKKKKYVQDGENLLQGVKGFYAVVVEKSRQRTQSRQQQKCERECHEQPAAPIKSKVGKNICSQDFSHRSSRFFPRTRSRALCAIPSGAALIMTRIFRP